MSRLNPAHFPLGSVVSRYRQTTFWQHDDQREPRGKCVAKVPRRRDDEVIVRWRTDAQGVQKAEYQSMTLVLESLPAEPGQPGIAVVVDGIRTRQRFHTPKAAMEATDAALRRQVTLLGAEVQVRQRALTPQKAARAAMKPVKVRKAVQSA